MSKSEVGERTAKGECSDGDVADELGFGCAAEKGIEVVHRLGGLLFAHPEKSGRRYVNESSAADAIGTPTCPNKS